MLQKKIFKEVEKIKSELSKKDNEKKKQQNKYLIKLKKKNIMLKT